MIGYLDAGGSPIHLAQALSNLVVVADYGSNPVVAELTQVDLTGDGVNELVWNLEVPASAWVKSIVILGCANRSYQLLYRHQALDVEPIGAVDVMTIEDLNTDGRPELAYSELGYGAGPGSSTDVSIIAWDGSSFVSLIEAGAAMGGGDAPSKFEDLDGDGTKELVARPPIGEGYGICDVGPFRATTSIYRWDGKHYTLDREDPDSPTYRIEAVEDGDRLTTEGRYPEALLSYQRAISDDTLKPGTAYYWLQAQPQYCGLPDPLPTPDIAEGPRLEAYSRYRLIVLYTALGQLDEAAAVYSGSINAFPQGHPARPYADLAKAFWAEFQSSKDIARACESAIDFAANNAATLLDPLGTANYGFLHDAPAPQEICPFPTEPQ
jgi:hypothetical protein